VLLVDVFSSSPSNEEKTDPILAIGTDLSVYGTNGGSDSGDGFTRLPTDTQYSGDLPRLFRFGNRYQVLEKLGEGGMGRVYKALDLELDRPVALKTIRTEKGRGPEVLKRFKQELILARKITHKNVVRIYDLGEAEGGVKFFTMELVEGQSLRDLLREKKTIPPKEAISFMRQMLSGLAEAHSQGVVHRDLKPQNIMVDRDGLLRIMDFGIARTADTATLTGSGEMMGTPDYISPEQVKGETANVQSDLYSAGIILYELLTGDVPFKGDTAISKVVARLQVKPTPPRTLNPQIPPYLERIILKLMEVDPDLRYKTAEEVLQDLEREQVDSSLFLRTRKALLRRRGWIAAVLVGSLGLGIWVFLRSPTLEVQADVPVTTIAILPFHNMTGDPDLEWMENGIQEMLITDVSQSRSLRPVLAERIARILEELGKDGESRFDEQTIQVIARTSGADFALHGRFIEAEGRLRVDLTLRNSRQGLDSPVRVDGTSTEIFALVDEMTTKVSASLEVDPWNEGNRPLADVSTSSVEAFRTYHQGVQELQKGSNQTARVLFERTVELDPEFAMAHAKLAQAHFNLGNDSAALQSARRAKALVEAQPLPIGERFQIHAIASQIEDDPDSAVTSYRELAGLYPQDPGVLLNLASSLEAQGSLDAAAVEYQKVRDLAPNYGAAVLGLGRAFVLTGRREEAISALDAALQSRRFDDDAETMGMIHSILGVAHLDSGRPDLALGHLEKSLDHRRKAEDVRGVTAALVNLAKLHLNKGDLDRARSLLEEGLALARQSGNSTMESFALTNLSIVSELSGDLDRAVQIARQSLEIEWERKEHTELADRLNYIGKLYASMGNYADAMVYLEQAKVHIAISEDPVERGLNFLHQGQVLFAKAQFNEAATAYLNAVSAFREADHLPGVANAHNGLSLVYLYQGRIREAQEELFESKDLSGSVGQPRIAARTHLLEARLLARIGDIDGAKRAVARGSEILSEMRGHDLGALRHLIEGEVAQARGEPREALNHWQNVRGQKGVDPLITLETSARIGEAEHRLGRLGPAITILESTLRETSVRRLLFVEADASLALAEALLAKGDVHAARGMVDKAVGLADGYGGKPLLQRAYVLSAELLEKQGDSKQAAEERARAEELREWLSEQVASLDAGETKKGGTDAALP
jgi:serine/threonine protein kinase/Tfp pilus assembly protein PilF